MCMKSSRRWILNHFVTLYVENQQLMMWRHVVPMYVINFYCWVGCVMKPIIIKKKCFLTTSFMMCSAQNMKERIIVMHRILKLGHNASNMRSHILSFVKQQTKKANLPIKTKYYKKVKNILNMISLVCHWNIGNAHPCRLAMVWCSSTYTWISKSRYDVFWWVAKSNANEKAHKRH